MRALWESHSHYLGLWSLPTCLDKSPRRLNAHTHTPSETVNHSDWVFTAVAVHYSILRVADNGASRVSERETKVWPRHLLPKHSSWHLCGHHMRTKAEINAKIWLKSQPGHQNAFRMQCFAYERYNAHLWTMRSSVTDSNTATRPMFILSTFQSSFDGICCLFSKTVSITLVFQLFIQHKQL